MSKIPKPIPYTNTHRERLLMRTSVPEHIPPIVLQPSAAKIVESTNVATIKIIEVLLNLLILSLLSPYQKHAIPNIQDAINPNVLTWLV